MKPRLDWKKLDRLSIAFRKLTLISGEEATLTQAEVDRFNSYLDTMIDLLPQLELTHAEAVSRFGQS